MKKVKSLLCLVLIIAVFCSAFALPAFASSIVRWNASYSPVSGNSDNADLPTGLEEVNMGDRIYFNAQVGSDVRLKEIKVYVKEPSQSSFYLYDSERANSFLRYAYFDYKIGNQAGELKFYFEFVDLNGDSRYTPEKSLTIKESGTTGTAWNAAYSHINGNYDADRITTDMYEANTGDRLWLNFQVGSRVQLRSIEVYVCPVGSNSFSYYDGEYASGSGFLRWAYFDYNVGNQPGTFKFRFKATATNGSSYTTPDYVIIIKQTNPTQSTSWVYPMKDAYHTWGNGNSWGKNCNDYGRSNNGGRNYHIGIDLYSSSDENVYTAANGEVVKSGYNSANGNYVIVQSNIAGKTVYAFYAHLASRCVSSGDEVLAGDKIGVVGNTGSAAEHSIKHLHFVVTDTLWNGSYYGYATYFTGDKTTYQNVTYYNPEYIIANGCLP